MFRKRIKREFAPGTFIPTPARICAIIQLCLAFMVILWNLSQPFMGEIFNYKSQILIYRDVMGLNTSSTHTEEIDHKNRNDRNKIRFDNLPLNEKTEIIQNYHRLQELSQRSFLIKLKKSFWILAFEIPFYEQIWLILSLVLPILLLKRIDGAVQAIWLLPLVTCAYALDNRMYALDRMPTSEEKLFPSEAILINNYLKQPLSSQLSIQKEQLQLAWNLYLVKEWAPKMLVNADHSEIDKNIDLKENMLELGEFAFNVQRIKYLPNSRNITSKNKMDGLFKRWHKEDIFILSIYLFWNFFFGIIVYQMKDKLALSKLN